MKKNLFIYIWLIGLGIFLNVSAGLAIEKPLEMTVLYTDNRITVNLVNAPLGAVLEDIRSKTGVDYQLSSDLNELKVNAAFRNLDLEAGLKKILSRVNNAFIFGPGRKIIKVAVFNKLDKTFADNVPVESEPGIVAMTDSGPGTLAEDLPADPKAPPAPLPPPSGHGPPTGPVAASDKPSDSDNDYLEEEKAAAEGPVSAGSPSIASLEGPASVGSPTDMTEVLTNPDLTPMPLSPDADISAPPGSNT